MDNPHQAEADLFSLDASMGVLDQDQVAVLKEAAQAAGPEFLRDLVDTFRDECGPRIDAIISTATAGDNSALRRHIHFIAGSAANTGMLRLATLCRRVEVQIDEGSFAAHAQVGELVRHEYDTALKAMAEIVGA